DMTFSNEEENIADRVFKQISIQNLVTPPIENVFKKITSYFDYDAKFLASLKQIDSVIGVVFLLKPQVQGILPPPQLTLLSQEEKNLDFYEMSGVIGANTRFDPAAMHAGFINVFPDEDGIIRHVPLLVSYHDGLYSSLALEAVRIYSLKKIEIV